MRVPLVTILVICLLFDKGAAQSVECKENEEFQECGSGCPLTCQNYREPLFCTENCKRGCTCRAGYVKGPDDKCIRPSQCPIGPCKDGEVASTCVNPCNNCIQKGKCYFEYCIKGCDCKPGYYRNSTDICVLADKCGSETHLCPPNEYYKECVNLCNDCWSKGHCSESYCQPGCDCNPGYFRDDYGTCVSEDHCENHDSGCGANEIFTDCANSCNDCEHKGHCDHYECHYGCDCKRGYFRDHNGVCIPESECAAIMCGHYEKYNECGSACPVTCDNYNEKVQCSLHCVKGCFCTQGYIRGPDGKCIKHSECPKVCGEYEEYSDCGTSCPIHCSNLTTLTSTPCTSICVKGCFCTAGYVRGPNGKCILQSACPLICGEYEEFKECGSSCIATCDNRAHIGDCSRPCTRGCFCISGYIQGPGGKCILPTSCPPVCGRNEEYQDCGSACPANCTNQNPTCAEVCVRGCFCKPGYIRDHYGICVLPTNCPLLCDENEIFMSCGPRCEPSCDAIHRNPALCPGCQRGCFCKPGYVRGPDKKCLLPISCPAACGVNEEFKDCGSACPANCSYPNPTCIESCVRGCFCKPGFIRNANYTCVLPTTCPAICGEYEEFSKCSSPCPPTCSNRNPTCASYCKEGCVCKAGYIRDSNGKCILLSECPLDCNEYEEFNECGSLCPPTCANRNPTCAEQCVRGCSCQPGYVKDAYGKCVLPSQCPEMCPENETFRLCGTSCPITCNNIGRSVSCKLHCNRGCFCNDGFVRGPNGTCITPDLCPMRCGQHEVLKECGTACQLTCANYTNPGPCTAPCVRGCFCKRGYVRNSRGRCILTKHCPARCKNNEVLSCSSRSCEGSCDDDDYSTRTCTDQCTNGCYCRQGFVRAPDGICVPRNMCPRVIGFEGRNKGDTALENDTVTSNSPETKPILTTKSNLELSTKLDEPILNLSTILPIIGTLLDEPVSTPADIGEATSQTALNSSDVTKGSTKITITTKSVPKELENPITNSPIKPSENPNISMTTKFLLKSPESPMTAESALKTSDNPMIAKTTKPPLESSEISSTTIAAKLPLESSEIPTLAITTKLPVESSENPTMAIESIVSELSIQNSTEIEATKADITELENTTPIINVVNETSINTNSTLSSKNDTTV